mgnify:CR=1 FL=1
MDLTGSERLNVSMAQIVEEAQLLERIQTNPWFLLNKGLLVLEPVKSLWRDQPNDIPQNLRLNPTWRAFGEATSPAAASADWAWSVWDQGSVEPTPVPKGLREGL